MTASSAAARLTFAVDGMDCVDCARAIEGAVRALPEVVSCAVDFGLATLAVELAPGADRRAGASRVVDAVKAIGYRLRPLPDHGAAAWCAHDHEDLDAHRVPGSVMPLPWWQTWRHHPRLRTAMIAGALWIAGWLVSQLIHANALPAILAVPSLVSLLGVTTETIPLLPALLYGAAIVLGGRAIARSGVQTLVRTRTFSIDFLMTAAVVGAALINQWSEGAAVVFLFSLGEGLESLTIDRTRRAIRSLMDLAPAEATVQRPAGATRVPLDAVAVGDVIEVRPGERIAMDGIVVHGTSTVNEAPITGESQPIDKAPGDAVFAGTINERGYLEVRVTRRVEDTTLAKIVHLVEEAQSRRAPSQRFVQQFARYYTPAVLVGAVLIAAIPPLLLGQPFLPWFYRALVLLVVSCPCALVISTPVAIIAAIGNASRRGVLIKGGASLEAAGTLRAIAFDKTGTLTEGRPEVVRVRTLNGYEPEELIALAATVEERSEHPLAAAILRRRAHEQANGTCDEHGDHAHTHGDDHVHLYPHDETEAELRAEVSDFEAITGRGARATIGARPYYVGSPQLFADLGADLQPLQATVAQWQQDGQTVLLVGSEREVYGAIGVADRARAQAAKAIAALRQTGIKHVIMLTGDNRQTARAIASRLGVDEFRAELLPDQKVAAVEELIRRYGRVGMVGDGVNDAPALATATVGVAMGAAGSDTALETADIALMADDLTKLPFVMTLSRRTLAIIRLNIAFALLVKVLFIALTFAGLSSLWLAILADTGASLVVIVNSMRLLGLKAPIDGSHPWQR